MVQRLRSPLLLVFPYGGVVPPSARFQATSSSIGPCVSLPCAVFFSKHVELPFRQILFPEGPKNRAPCLPQMTLHLPWLPTTRLVLVKN